MTRRTGTATVILSFALVPWGIEACGRAANVLEYDPPDWPDGSSNVGGMEGGTGGFPASGGRVGPMASPYAGGGPSAGGGPGTGGIGPEDPNAELRSQLIGELCAIPARFPCLTLATGVEPYSTTEEQLENCREQTERQYQSTLGIHCWDQWYANATCALRQTDYCPCDADSGHCVFSPRAYSFSPACNETYFLFLDCAVTLGNVAGSAGTFTFEQSDAGCFVQGLAANGVDKIEAHCTGPRGGLQDCTCVKNGAELGGQGVSFLGHGCTNVAQLVSSGECSGPQPRCVGGPAR